MRLGGGGNRLGGRGNEDGGNHIMEKSERRVFRTGKTMMGVIRNGEGRVAGHLESQM